MEYAALSGVVYRNTAHALVTIARQERLRGLFSGLGPTLLRDAPYSGLYLLMFSNIRDAMGAGEAAGPETAVGTTPIHRLRELVFLTAPDGFSFVVVIV